MTVVMVGHPAHEIFSVPHPPCFVAVCGPSPNYFFVSFLLQHTFLSFVCCLDKFA